MLVNESNENILTGKTPRKQIDQDTDKQADFQLNPVKTRVFLLWQTSKNSFGQTRLLT